MQQSSSMHLEVGHLDLQELLTLMAECAGEVGRRVAVHTYGTSQLIDLNAPGKELFAGRDGQSLNAAAAGEVGEQRESLKALDTLMMESVSFQRELLEVCTVIASQARAVAGLAATRVEDSGVWRKPGTRSFGAYLIGLLQVRYATAKDIAATGRLIRETLTGIGRGVLTGALRWDHAVAGRDAATSSQRRAALAAPTGPDVQGTPTTGEEELAQQATRMDAQAFRKVAARFASRTDPEADDRGYKDAVEREYLTLAPTPGGYHIQGFLTEDHGKLLTEAIRSVAGTPAAGDDRTPEQRRAGALADLARLVLTQGLTGSGQAVRPQLIVTVDFATFQAALTQAGLRFDPGHLAGLEPAQWADGSGPVPPGVLERLACDSRIARVVFGPQGEVLNYGRAHRRFTGQQRAALIARDRHCQFIGCTAPPVLCDGHHVDYWSNGGGTDLSNAILVCGAHHRHIHTYDIEVRYEPDGTWGFYLPDGTRVPQPGEDDTQASGDADGRDPGAAAA